VSPLRWVARPAATLLLIAVIWASTGIGAYLYLSSHRSSFAIQARKPTETRVAASSPLGRLPGTMYIVQEGALYRLQRGTFTPLLKAPGAWTQPAVAPSGQSLVVVRRDYESSDLFLVDSSGRIEAQLTHDASRVVEANHWSFYPSFSADGRQVFFSYDAKDRFNSYNVVLAVYQMPLGAPQTQARRWTSPEGYTGGDLQPVPLAQGGVIYTKYSFDQATGRILGQVWLTSRVGAVGRALTRPEDDCSQPSLSPDGRRLAMVCTGAKQFTNIEVASFDGTLLGPRQVLLSGQLAAQPTWAPDDSGLVYLAPGDVSGHFELWFQALPPAPVATPTAAAAIPASPPPGARVGRATPSPPAAIATPLPAPTPPPAPPIQLTADLDFDATSTIAWHL
jgi:hypothetical protein